MAIQTTPNLKIHRRSKIYNSWLKHCSKANSRLQRSRNRSKNKPRVQCTNEKTTSSRTTCPKMKFTKMLQARVCKVTKLCNLATCKDSKPMGLSHKRRSVSWNRSCLSSSSSSTSTQSTSRPCMAARPTSTAQPRTSSPPGPCSTFPMSGSAPWLSVVPITSNYSSIKLLRRWFRSLTCRPRSKK